MIRVSFHSDFVQALSYLVDGIQIRQPPVVEFNFGFKHGRILLCSRNDHAESDAAHLHQHRVDEFSNALWAFSIDGSCGPEVQPEILVVLEVLDEQVAAISGYS